MNYYTYKVILTEEGTWKHAASSDFLFTYIPNDMSPSDKTTLANAFEAALSMSTTIKTAVKNTSGQDVVNGLYLEDQSAMTMAMNSIPGMGMTSSDQSHQSGSGTAVKINLEFFAAVLAGLGGDPAPMTVYLQKEMGEIQAQTKKTEVTKTFGTVMGLISLMPDLGVAITTFKYVFSSEKTSEWFVSVNCGSTEKQSYDYSYIVVDYNYVKPEQATKGGRSAVEIVQESRKLIQRAY